MDEAIKTIGADRKVRNVIHRVNKDWNNRMTAALTKEVDTEQAPKSGNR